MEESWNELQSEREAQRLMTTTCSWRAKAPSFFSPWHSPYRYWCAELEKWIALTIQSRNLVHSDGFWYKKKKGKKEKEGKKMEPAHVG
jgi:hypothetical protein